MRTRSTHIVAALLVGVLTVLAPDGAMSALHANDSVGARFDAATAAGAAGHVEPAEGAQSAPVSASALSGAVTVTVTVVAPFVPAPTSIPIYRFYSPRSGTHFYTPSAEERDMVIARWPDVWHYEGVAYTVNPAGNTQPLYRFYNYYNGSHFYTASPTERDMVLARWSKDFHYDGPTYSVTPYSEAGKTPVYRFYNKKNGSHFYTASAEEANHVIITWPQIYQLEGTAFWLGQ